MNAPRTSNGSGAVLASHPTGNENSRHAALALAEDGELLEFWTCLGTSEGNSSAIGRALRRRAVPRPVFGRTRLAPLRESVRLVAGAVGIREPSWATIDAVYRSLDRKVARRLSEVPGVAAVFGYEDGVRDSFTAARRRGVRCLYELPMGYWREWHRIMREEAELKPEWASTLHGIQDDAAKLERKDEELHAADQVIVASSFARRSLERHHSFRGGVTVIPYGTSCAELIGPAEDSRELRVIYVGSLTQRKGIAYLFEAVATCGVGVRLTIIGARPRVQCPQLDAALAKCEWIPSADRQTVLATMARCDVLVLPSLFEGFGLVILEAMACGLVVIGSNHTGAADVVTEGVDGFVVPIRSASAIAEKFELLIRDRARLREMRGAARRKAETLSWESYRRAFSKFVRKSLS